MSSSSVSVTKHTLSHQCDVSHSVPCLTDTNQQKCTLFHTSDAPRLPTHR